MTKLTRGERFKDARIVHNQHNKQTMDEVAAATGVSKSLIQSLEDDTIKRSVGYDKVAKLAAHYRVTTDYLLGLSDNPFPENNTIDDLGLSPKAVKALQLIRQISTDRSDYLSLYNAVLGSNDFQTVMMGVYKFLQAAVADDIYHTERAKHFNKYDPFEGNIHINEFYKRILDAAEDQAQDLLLSNTLRYFLMVDKLNTDGENELILPDASITPAVVYDVYKAAPLEAFEQMIKNLASAYIRDSHKDE